MTKKRTKIPALDDKGKFIYDDKGSGEIQTYTMSKALQAYKEGYAVYIAHPLDEDPDDRMFSAEEIMEANGHLFIIPVYLYNNGSLKLATTATGISVTGGGTFTSTLKEVEIK